MYWTPEHQQAVALFLLCSSATTSASTRQYLYNTILYPVFDIIIDKCMAAYRFNREDREDVKQDSHIKLYNILINKLQQQLLKGILQYIWLTVENTILTHKRQKSISFTSLEQLIEQQDSQEITQSLAALMPDICNDDYCADKCIRQQDIRIDIIDAIDKKMLDEKEYSVASMYLQLMKDYLISNDFDALNFKRYVKQQMDWKEGHFRVVNCLLDIRTKEFRTVKL